MTIVRPPGTVNEVVEQGGALTLVLAEREGLLELVEHDHDVLVRRAVRRSERHSEMQCARVAREFVERPLHATPILDRDQLDGQRGERVRAGPEDQQAPAFAARELAGPQRGHEACADERGLATARCPEHGQEPAELELFEQSLDVAVAAEEQLGMLFFEHLQPAVGGCIALRADQWARADRDALHGVNQIPQCARTLNSVAEVNPCTHAKEQRERVGVKRLEPRQQYREDAVPRVLRGTIQGGSDLQPLPRPEVVRSYEDRARCAESQSLSKFILPRPSGRHAPDVKPRRESLPHERPRDPLDGCRIAPVMRQ
jgi:hypothetical protein